MNKLIILSLAAILTAPIPMSKAGEPLSESCLSCHENVINKPNVSQMVYDSGCTLCHGTPTDESDQHKGLKSLSERLKNCQTCHSKKEGIGNHKTDISYKTKYNNPRPKDLVLIGDKIVCITCHNPHSSEHENLLQKAYVPLCHTCHLSSRYKT